MTQDEKGKREKKSAVFLDRDGTIITDKHFLSDPDLVEILPGAVEGIRILNECGIPVVVVSNQSGVARGYFGIDAVDAVNNRIAQIFSERGAKIDKFYFCPHHPEGEVEEFKKECDCRKPKTGMAEKASKELCINLKKSFVVGDKISDLEFAKNIEAKAILVRTGEGSITESEIGIGDVCAVFDTFSGAVEFIVRSLENK